MTITDIMLVFSSSGESQKAIEGKDGVEVHGCDFFCDGGLIQTFERWRKRINVLCVITQYMVYSCFCHGRHYQQFGKWGCRGSRIKQKTVRGKRHVEKSSWTTVTNPSLSEWLLCRFLEVNHDACNNAGLCLLPLHCFLQSTSMKTSPWPGPPVSCRQDSSQRSRKSTEKTKVTCE